MLNLKHAFEMYLFHIILAFFPLDIFSYLLFNFNDYPSGMVTLFNLLVMGNWQVWMEVRIFLCSIKRIKVVRIVFLINAKTSGKVPNRFLYLLTCVSLSFFLILSELLATDWKFLEPDLFCQLLPYFNITTA